MSRMWLCMLLVGFGSAGCAVVKTTDVTDSSFKRHQSVSILGWPLYTRITDRDRGLPDTVAVRRFEEGEDPRVRAAELLGRSIDIEE